VDEGAVTALRTGGRSLLPAGVKLVEGTFARGESVEVRDSAGRRIAAGTCNYASEELDRIRGIRSDRITDVLGYAYGEEAIHRDNLILL
jgi:glutamate 5-kinase